MTAALSTWLGLVIVILAVVLPVVVDLIRQAEPSSYPAPANVRGSQTLAARRWVRALTVLAFVLAALAAGATVVRFLAYT